MHHFSTLLQFRIDPLLPLELRKIIEIMLSGLEGIEKSESLDSPKSPNKFLVDFVSENSLHLLKTDGDFSICLVDKNQGLFSFGQNIDESSVDALLDEGIDLNQVERLILPHLMKHVRSRESHLRILGTKNLRKFENKIKKVLSKNGEESFSSDFLLTYAQSLVDLEKELIQTDGELKIEKILKQFIKNNIEKAKFCFYTTSNLSQDFDSESFLILPTYMEKFVGLELNWDDSDPQRLFKKLFLYYTLINYFRSRQGIVDPFVDEVLWEDVLDAIPFPVALLSKVGAVHQHNSLFAKLGYSPIDCLNLKLREKIMINDIPYNIYRKEIHHVDQEKILYVFFTESFFLKGDGNHTPSGQELGIISSSIAHELNNPIAGIQAAISLLQLDDSMNQETAQILSEMKSGATRCKQLIETFLGFSRANPKTVEERSLSLSPIELCYQQAQNLLRFRTVESGIRFNFNSIKHAEFRAHVNPSLLTMTFYLLLGELMTLYSHQLLVANKNQIEKVIKGEIIESSQEIQIQLHELNISGLGLSKLIQNLLNIENFVLQISDYSLRFIHNP